MKRLYLVLCKALTFGESNEIRVIGRRRVVLTCRESKLHREDEKSTANTSRSSARYRCATSVLSSTSSPIRTKARPPSTGAAAVETLSRAAAYPYGTLNFRGRGSVAHERSPVPPRRALRRRHPIPEDRSNGGLMLSLDNQISRRSGRIVPDPNWRYAGSGIKALSNTSRPVEDPCTPGVR
jgi:hypothetical protein